MKIKSLFSDFISLFYPRLCIICQKPLMEEENYMCLHCLLRLPLTSYHFHSDNPACDRFKGKIPYEKATSYIFYNKGGMAQQIISEIKYRGNYRFGTWMGEYLAKHILHSNYFHDIDFLVPVPLHPKKLKKRGFNQAEALALGISQITKIPINKDCLYRKISNPTQTKKGSYERWTNTRDIFAIRESETFDEKHILLIDDVLTTGSTLEACAKSLLTCKNIKISVLTLTIA